MAVLEHLKPTLVAGLERAPLPAGGLVLIHPALHTYVELSAEDVAFLEGFDGTTTLAASARRHTETHGEPGFRRLVPLCRDLAAAGMLRLPDAAHWPAEWGVEPRPVGGRSGIGRWALPSPGLGRLVTSAWAPLRALPAASIAILAAVASLGMAAALAIGPLGGGLPEASLSAISSFVGWPLLLTAWGALGFGLSARETMRGLAAVCAGGRVLSVGLALRWGVPVLAFDARDAARAGSRGRRLLALSGLAGGALAIACLALVAALGGPGVLGYGAAAGAMLATCAWLVHLCPLLPGDLGAALVELAPDDRFAPRLRSYLSRGILYGMVRGARERRGIAVRPGEERFYLLSSLLCGLWTWGTLDLQAVAAGTLGDALLAPAVTATDLPVAARVGAAGLLLALTLVSAAVSALAILPLLLWIRSIAWPVRPSRPRSASDATPPTPEELGRYPLFGRLRPADLAAVAAACEVQRFKAGDVVVRQGDPGDAFYAIRVGRALVWVEDHTGHKSRVATLEEGDAFGELALVEGRGRRAATVRAATPLSVLRLDRGPFERALAAQSLAPSEVTELLGETRLLSRLPFFSDFGADALARISLQLQPHPVAAGEEVVRQGERGEHFFIVHTGALEVQVDGSVVGRLGPGDCFGEIALLQRVPRTATVVCTEAAHLLRLSDADFMQAVDASFRFGEHVDALSARRSAEGRRR